jgi:hypothetical protein
MDKDIFHKWLDSQENPQAEPPMPSCCGNCRFASKTQTLNQLACIRYPPQAFLLPPNQILSQFPIVQSRQLCGEWQPQLDT